MTPYYADDLVTIYHGDCREVLPSLSLDLSVDLCFDDPPYLQGDWWEMFPMLRASAARLVVTPGAANAWHWTQQAQPFWTYAWASASTSLGGSACLHIGWEPVLAFDRPRHPLGTDLLNFPISKQEGVGGHPWPKPLPLIRKLIAHFSEAGELVLDPHLGVGTTLVAAKSLNRKAIGIEIEERYCEIAANRCRQEVLGLAL